MKKLMKKIKSNKLISKLVAVLTICMVLLSSLSVSAFAADDEVSAANEETESITDVWTDVMSWITSSLTSVQGVFYVGGSISPVSLQYLGNTGSLSSFLISGLDFVPTDGQTVTFVVSSEGETETISFVLEPFEKGYISTISSGSAIFVLAYLSNDNEWNFGFNGPADAITSGFVSISYVDSPSGGLTFLGTLAVIGVAIAIAFLIVSVISRFFRLWG